MSVGLITGLVFILFLYSPLGSPGLYRSSDYYVINTATGVHFNGEIENSSRSTRISSEVNDDQSFQLPQISSSGLSNPNSLSSVVRVVRYSEKNRAGGKDVINRDGSRNIESDAGFISSARISSSTSGKRLADNSGIQSIAIQSLTASLSVSESKPFAVSASINDGGTDPGGDPEEPPIPVSNGVGILLLLALGYTFYKMNRNKRFAI